MFSSTFKHKSANKKIKSDKYNYQTIKIKENLIPKLQKDIITPELDDADAYSSNYQR